MTISDGNKSKQIILRDFRISLFWPISLLCFMVLQTKDLIRIEIMRRKRRKLKNSLKRGMENVKI